jgi:hypothetical protein
MTTPNTSPPGREVSLVRRSDRSWSLAVPDKVKYVVVISRLRLDLYVEMSRDFAGDPYIKVVLDRRRMERGRRVAARPKSPGDRRQRERRLVEEQHRELATHGYVIVRPTTSSRNSVR